MTRQGDTFVFPDGTNWLVERAPADTPDGSVHFIVTVPPNVFAPPPHRHPVATDSYEVMKGSYAVKVNGRWQTLEQGDRADVPPQAVHTLANRSGADALVRNIHRPASGFDEFVAHVDRLIRARNITNIKDPRVPILFALLTLEYPETLIPGRARDRAMTSVLAGLGRLLGMTTEPDS